MPQKAYLHVDFEQPETLVFNRARMRPGVCQYRAGTYARCPPPGHEAGAFRTRR